MTNGRRVMIVGGVAGGATCATRLRRLDESAEIVVFDRGPYVSFANCGLPYYVGNVIREESKLLVATPQLFRSRFNIDVRVENEVLSIDREAGEIEVRERGSGRTYRERYDVLVLSPGASPIRPPLPGVDLPGIFVLRTIPDSRKIRDWLLTHEAHRAVVVGGGFVGLEMAENLVQRGLEVSIVEAADQLMPPLDADMAAWVHERVRKHVARVVLGDPVASFEAAGDGLAVTTRSGLSLQADLVILAIGVRPETDLARRAGLEIGARGGIVVDGSMRTNDPHIWAVGDAVESPDVVTGEVGVYPLAGPANRQGRIAADAICGRDVRFRGVQGTAICGFFGLTTALTGATEKTLARAGISDYEAVFIHPGNHVAYYPGSTPIHLKLLFRPSDGRVLGAQAVGESGVERRIDVISMAIQLEASVYDLEEAELCYAPQYGAAKDPVNVVGMVAANVGRGDASLAPWPELPGTTAFLLDVREAGEYEVDHIDGAVNIPLGQLRERIEEIPRDRETWVSCGVGQRAYYAVRLLRQHGIEARTLSGGNQTFRTWYPKNPAATPAG